MNLRMVAPCFLATIISSHPLLADSGQETDMLELDLETLMTIQVGPSADASAAGLTRPYAGGEIAEGGRIGILNARSMMTTPFSMTSYTQEFIQNHQAASVGDVLQYDPSVRVARGFGNFQQVYKVRGFPIFSDDMTYNGLYGILPRQYLAAELIERAKVLRGANSFINGAAPGVSGCLGGTIDIIPKRAPKENLAQVTLGAQSGIQSYAATDLAARSSDGSLGIRLNAVNTQGDRVVDNESRRLDMAILGTDYRGTALRLSADIGYQDYQLDAAQPSVTIAPNLAIPHAPDAADNIAQPWTYSNERDVFGTVRAEYDFNESITGWLAGGARNGEENSIFGAFLTVNNTEGDFSANRFDVTHQDSISTGELGLRIGFDTSNIEHKLTVSANAYENNSRNAYVYYDAFSNNLYNPSRVPSPTTIIFSGGDLQHPQVTSDTQTASIALVDELSLLDEQLLLTLGARHQNIREQNYDYITGDKVSLYDESRITPVVGVVYTLSSAYSLYANHIEGLLKGDQAPATNENGAVANAGENLRPYQTKQVELGVKYSADSLGASFGIFEIRKPLAGYNNQNTFIPTHHQTHKGLEILVYGEPLSGLKILGGASFLDTHIRSKEAIGAPDTQANLGLEWHLTKIEGLSLNTHWMYTSAQYADMENTQKVPNWNRLDLGVRYSIKAWDSNHLTLRANVENATGNNYWASVGGFPGASYLTQGEPRTLRVSLSVDF